VNLGTIRKQYTPLVRGVLFFHVSPFWGIFMATLSGSRFGASAASQTLIQRFDIPAARGLGLFQLLLDVLS